MPSSPKRLASASSASDARSDRTSQIISEAQTSLEALAPEAVSTLRSVMSTGEDGPRVKAATEILDRIGVSRRQLDSSVSFPPEMLASVVAGMAAMCGIRSAPDLRLPRVVSPPSSAGVISNPSAGIISNPSANPPTRKRKRAAAAAAAEGPSVTLALTGKLNDMTDDDA